MRLLRSTQIVQGVSYSAGYSNGASVTIVHAKPSSKLNEKLHFHSKDFEYFYVIKGELGITVENKIITVKKGTCLETKPREIHKIVSIKKGTEYIVIRTNTLPGEKITID